MLEGFNDGPTLTLGIKPKIMDGNMDDSSDGLEDPMGASLGSAEEKLDVLGGLDSEVEGSA